MTMRSAIATLSFITLLGACGKKPAPVPAADVAAAPAADVAVATADVAATPADVAAAPADVAAAPAADVAAAPAADAAAAPADAAAAPAADVAAAPAEVDAPAVKLTMKGEAKPGEPEGADREALCAAAFGLADWDAESASVQGGACEFVARVVGSGDLLAAAILELQFEGLGPIKHEVANVDGEGDNYRRRAWLAVRGPQGWKLIAEAVGCEQQMGHAQIAANYELKGLELQDVAGLGPVVSLEFARTERDLVEWNLEGLRWLCFAKAGAIGCAEIGTTRAQKSSGEVDGSKVDTTWSRQVTLADGKVVVAKPEGKTNSTYGAFEPFEGSVPLADIMTTKGFVARPAK